MLDLAHTGAPAGGAPLHDLVAAGIVAAVVLAALAVVTIVYRRGGAAPLRKVVGSASEWLGLPAWAALPALLCSASLAVAVFGYYWDVSTHIDNGRDPGPFANPSHFFILGGLAGIALAGYLSVLVGENCETRSSVRVRNLTMPLGGFLLLLTGVVALAGFPLDDVWHRLFGQDVTLWGPTHIQMIGGGSLATLAMWVLLAEARPFRSTGRAKPFLLHARAPFVAGAFLLALSTLQGEFDFGVPQFRLVYHPILLMLAASIGLVVSRLCLGRGGALTAALVFIVLRGLISLAVGPGLGRITMHFPLYLAEAAIVELVALRVPPAQPISFGLVSGIGIGTIGLAAEWAWSHVWMPIPWPAELLPEGAVLGVAAAVAGGALGALIANSLSEKPRDVARSWVAVAAGLTAILCLAWPAPMRLGSTVSARVTLQEVRNAPERSAVVTARLDPADAAKDALWFHGLAWQGLNWDRGSSKLIEVEKVSPGVYRTTQPLPVGGDWKSMLRLHVDDRLLALPIYLPEDPAIPAPEVAARNSFERSFVTDKQIVQREAITSNVWLQRIGYCILLLIGALWIAVFAWALARLGQSESSLRGRTGRARPSVRQAASVS